ncbi:MAG: D-tyrosyl-tRNA(Tyr) deacylase [Planctomycetota bacterium]|nr:MAG: D-tyrosyl-tRNA(Tyr) deacylase [Planctomycetota bacterium]
MRAVVQRVSQAAVHVGGETVGAIERGLLVFLGVARTDTLADVQYLARKIVDLRIFEDADGKMNLSLRDVRGAMLVVSQFTLLGDCRKGRRPSFVAAAPPDKAETLYRCFIDEIEQFDIPVASGRFQEHMHVALVNDGPVTLLLDSTKLF